MCLDKEAISMDNMENKNENVQDQQNAPVDGEYSFFYGLSLIHI